MGLAGTASKAGYANVAMTWLLNVQSVAAREKWLNPLTTPEVRLVKPERNERATCGWPFLILSQFNLKFGVHKKNRGTCGAAQVSI